MDQKIRGLRCSLDYYCLANFLRYLSKKAWKFYIPWCFLDGIITVRDYRASTKDLETLDKHRIWELELQCYPHDAIQVDIANYQEFCTSLCACYLLYFDCGYLEIYVKQLNVFRQFWDYLVSLGAKDLVIVTDTNDTRAKFTVG